MKHFNFIILLMVLMSGFINAMDPSLCHASLNSIQDVRSALFKAIDRNDVSYIKNLLSHNIVTQLDSRKKYGLCVAVLSEAMWKIKCLLLRLY